MDSDRRSITWGSQISKASKSSIGSKLSSISSILRKGTAFGFKSKRYTSHSVALMVGVVLGDIVETVSMVTVRKEESIDSDIVTDLPVGTVLEILELGGGRRIKITTRPESSSACVGWVSSKTQMNEPLVAKHIKDDYGTFDFEVGGQHECQYQVTVRKGEGLDSEFLAELQPGTVVKIVEIGKQNNRRALITSAVCDGWISTSTRCGHILIGKVEDISAGQGKQGGISHSNRVKQLLEASRSGDNAKFRKIVEGPTGLTGKFFKKLNLNASDIRGNTALIYACAFGRKEIVRSLLCRKDVEVNAVDDTQKSALHHACKGARSSRDTTSDECQATIVAQLIEAGAYMEARDHNGCTALMCAAANGYVKVALVLIQNEVSVNCEDFMGNSVMAYAKNFSHSAMVKLLIDSGAQVFDDSDNEEEPECEEVVAAGTTEKTDTSSGAVVAEATPAIEPVGETQPGSKNKAKMKSKSKAKGIAKKGKDDGDKPKAKAKGKAKAANKIQKGAAMLQAMGEDADGIVADAEVVIQEAAKEEEDEKVTALRKLTLVLNSVESPKELESVIQQCEAAGASEEELKAAHEKVKELRLRQDVLSQLHEAVRAKDVEALKAAIAKAKDQKLSKKEIDAAAKVLKEETPRAEARKCLEEAQSTGKAKEMKDAIARAKKAGLPADELKEWEDMLASSENKDQAQKALTDALKARPLAVPDLEWAIGQAKSAGVAAAKIAEVEELLRTEGPKIKARTEIQAALASMDDSHLATAIACSKSCGLAPEEYAPCEEAIERKKKQVVLLRGVKDVLEATKTCDLTDVDAVIEAKKKVAVAIAEALSVGVPEGDLLDAELRRKKLHNTVEDLKGAIRVFCRIRPMNKREKDLKDHTVTSSPDPMTLAVKEDKGDKGSTVHKFQFDAVFVPGTQEEIFEDCKDLVQSAADGYNVTLFAYGQTGAGKTFTMAGVPGMLGVSPRTIEEIFRVTKANESRFAFTILGSMLELYCQDLVDLLSKGNSAAGKKKLAIREQMDKSITVEHLSAEQCQSANDLHDLLDRGMSNRATAATAMNSESSRSHLVLMIQIISVNRETQETTKGKILIVDLAGSERLGKSQTTGQAQKESIEINKSLTCLGNVISALTQPKKGQIIPYRDSNLTLVMKDALGGTAKTLMFVNCSPANNNVEETLNSLKYAQRAKHVQNTQEKKR